MNFGTKQAENSLCLGCLGAGKMYSIRQYNLLEPYLLLTGLKIPDNDIQKKHFCQFCSSLLKKYTAFRERCLRSFQYINKISNKISEEFISQYTATDLFSYCKQESININKCDIKTDDSDDHIIYNDVKNKSININSCDDFEDHQMYHDTKGKFNVKKDIKNDESSDHEQNCDNDVVESYDVITHDSTYCDIKSENEGTFTNNIDNKIKKLTNHDNKIILKKICLKSKKNHEKKQEFKNGLQKTVLQTKLSRKPTFKLSTDEGRRIFEKKYSVSIKIMTEEEKMTDLRERHAEILGGVKCILCFKYFKNENLLRTHTMEMHDESKPESCNYCGYRTDTRRSLQYHTVRNHKYILTCLICQLHIRTPIRVAEHHRVHSGQTLSCRFCGVVCKKSKHYRLHLRKAHPSELTWCYICGEVFLSLENHLRASHKDVLKNNYKCTKCNSYFKSQGILDEHKHIQTDSTCGMSCYHCAERFADEELLREHFDGHKLTERKTVARSQKKSDGSKNANGTGGVCDICGKVMRTNNGMVYHMMIHSGDLPYSCERCSKKFRCKTSLLNHCRVHSGERPYTCEFCRKAFTTQAGLYRHRRVHTGEKIHQCEICTKFYSTSSGLKAHVKAVHMKMPLIK